jgi:hypothetical protein
VIEGEGPEGLTRRVTINYRAEELFRPRRCFFATRFSGGHTGRLGRIRRYFCIRLAERLCLFGKRTHLRLHELSLNSNNLLKILGLAQLVHTIGGS